MTVSLAAELIVGILLILTIAYCFVLNRRLKIFRADEEMMRDVIADLLQATARAEHAIHTLKATAEDCEDTLSMRIKTGDALIRRLEAHVRDGHAVLAQHAPDGHAQEQDAAAVQDAPPRRPVGGSALEAIRSRAA